MCWNIWSYKIKPQNFVKSIILYFTKSLFHKNIIICIGGKTLEISKKIIFTKFKKENISQVKKTFSCQKISSQKIREIESSDFMTSFSKYSDPYILSDTYLYNNNHVFLVVFSAKQSIALNSVQMANGWHQVEQRALLKFGICERAKWCVNSMIMVDLFMMWNSILMNFYWLRPPQIVQSIFGIWKILIWFPSQKKIQDRSGIINKLYDSYSDSCIFH